MKSTAFSDSATRHPVDTADVTAAAVGKSEHLWIAPSSRGLLEAARLDDFDAVMNTTDGHRLRRLADRENWRLELADRDGEVHRAYLKKHRLRNLGTWLRCRLGLGAGRSAGRVEADNVCALRQQGIPTMSLMAFGERLDGDGWLTSFLLTEELTGYTQLDDFLVSRFSGDGDAGHGNLRQLINQVADVARRFHRLGYNHRDLYTCHFFIRESEAGRFDVNLIDLQRVQRRSRFRRRWVVKDLAQLAYSSPRNCIGRRERMAFIRRYLGVRRLRPHDKRFIRSILSKERRMLHKLGPYQ